MKLRVWLISLLLFDSRSQYSKQDFINTTAIELGKDYLKFAKMKYPNDEVEHILAQVLRLESLTSKNRDRTKRQTSEVSGPSFVLTK